MEARLTIQTSLQSLLRLKSQVRKTQDTHISLEYPDTTQLAARHPPMPVPWAQFLKNCLAATSTHKHTSFQARMLPLVNTITLSKMFVYLIYRNCNSTCSAA
jgi:hypothetical protein